jgi:hypothetical protein
MKPTNAPKVYVVLRRPRQAAPFLSMAKAILAGVTNAKATFPTPTPPLTQLTNDINAFDTAQTSALTRAKGAVQARNAAMAVVVADLDLLRAYVQTVADADPSNALPIAHSAGMDLRKTKTVSKNDLNAKSGKVSGSIAVSARVAGVRASHEWQYSTDGGKTWISAPSSLQAKTTISGLTPLTTVSVRHRAVTKAGPQDWTQPVTVNVQ